MKVTKADFVNNAFWRMIEAFATKGVSFVVSIILARLLLPEDYGLLALTAVFTTFSDMLIDSGFCTALIRKEKVDDIDYSSVLIMSMGIATVLYVAIFILAPFIGAFYEEPNFAAVLRVMSLVLFVQAFNSTRSAKIARNMCFKMQFNCNVIASIVSGATGIILAYLGYGVWALVAQQLLQTILSTVLVLIKMKWHFKLALDRTRLKEMFRFGSGVIGSGLINYLATSVSNAVVGKHYSVRKLGYYDKGGTDTDADITIHFYCFI